MSAEPVKVSIGAFQNRRRRGSSFIINHNWVHAQCAASVLKPRPDEKKNGSVSLMWFIKKKKKIQISDEKGLVWTRPYNCKAFRIVKEQEKESRKLLRPGSNVEIYMCRT